MHMFPNRHIGRTPTTPTYQYKYPLHRVWSAVDKLLPLELCMVQISPDCESDYKRQLRYKSEGESPLLGEKKVKWRLWPWSPLHDLSFAWEQQSRQPWKQESESEYESWMSVLWVNTFNKRTLSSPGSFLRSHIYFWPRPTFDRLWFQYFKNHDIDDHCHHEY